MLLTNSEFKNPTDRISRCMCVSLQDDYHSGEDGLTSPNIPGLLSSRHLTASYLICLDAGMTHCSFFNPHVDCSQCWLITVSSLIQSICFQYYFYNMIHPLLSSPFFPMFYPGGFIFKQWKKRFLHLTAEGSLFVCHDALSPPNQMVLLQSNCEAIVEGKDILDLPKLPSGACRDCCFALILPQNKYLLLLAETSADCRSGGHAAFSAYRFALVHLFRSCSAVVWLGHLTQLNPAPIMYQNRCHASTNTLDILRFA